jgi:hypothetical protein
MLTSGDLQPPLERVIGTVDRPAWGRDWPAARSRRRPKIEVIQVRHAEILSGHHSLPIYRQPRPLSSDSGFRFRTNRVE